MLLSNVPTQLERVLVRIQYIHSNQNLNWYVWLSYQC